MKYKPHKILGPGFSIRRNLKSMNWTQRDLAEVMEYSEAHINRILTNKEPITMKVAKLLSKIIGSTPQYWVSLDTNYRLQLEESATEKATSARALIYRYMPIRDMRDKGWISKTKDDLINSVKQFWGISELKFDFIDKQVAVCFRKSNSYNQFRQHYALTWFHKAQKNSKKLIVPNYNKAKLEKLVELIPYYSTQKDGINEFLQELKNTGVKFIYLPHLEKTYIDGAAFLDNGTPAIAYSARNDRIDDFWWTLTHELGHILKHLNNENSIILDSFDDIDITDMTEEKEIEANEFAQKILKTNEILDFVKNSKRITKKKVALCAKELKISEEIVIGILKYKEKINSTSMNDRLNIFSDKIGDI